MGIWTLNYPLTPTECLYFCSYVVRQQSNPFELSLGIFFALSLTGAEIQYEHKLRDLCMRV